MLVSDPKWDDSINFCVPFIQTSLNAKTVIYNNLDENKSFSALILPDTVIYR